MNRIQSVGAALAAALSLSACETPPSARQQSGAVIGGIVGGVIGSEIGDHSGAGALLGVLAGAALGGAIGRSMDQQDRIRTARVLESAKTGAPTQWINPDTGYTYRVVPTRTYGPPATPCREYTVDAVIGTRKQQVHGTACRQADGSWKVTD